MSERKVLQKYYPPDFDHRQIERRRGPKATGPKLQTVRIMAPFSMKCTACGEFIYKGRKFNSRKETDPSDKYLGITIVKLHIKCTRCSSEITIRTDPKNSDYVVSKGAVRNFEPWRNREAENETDEQRLDRLEREEAEAAGEEDKNAMAELEAKNEDARREMAAADALDEMRQRNARIHRSEKQGVDFADTIVRSEDEERERQEMEDEAAAKKAFAAARARAEGPVEAGESSTSAPSVDESRTEPPPDSDEALMPPPPVPTTTPAAEPAAPAAPAPSFKRVVKKKKDHSALLGIKKKPSLV